MSSGLRANSVFATFGVKTDEWTKGLQKIVAQTARTLKQVEGIGSKLGELGMVWGASLGAAIAVASDSSPALKSALDSIKNSFLDIAAEVGVQFLPMMQALAGAVQRAAVFVQSLNPELKAGLANIAGFGTAALVAAGALGKFSGYGAAALEGLNVAIGGVTSAFKGIGLIIGGVSVPILAVVAVVALLVLAAGAFYKAWNTAGNGFREKVLGILDTIVGWGRSVGDFFGGIWENVSGFMRKAAVFMLDQVAQNIRGLGTLLAGLSKVLPDSLSSKISGIAQTMQGMTGEKLMGHIGDAVEWAWDKTKIGAEWLVERAVVVGEAIQDGVMYSVDGLMMAGEELKKKFGNLIPDLTGGGPAIRRLEKSTEKDSDTNGKLTSVAKPEPIIKPAVDAAKQAADALKSKFTSALGPLPGLVESFQMGMTAGGPWAGVAAIAADLLSQSSQFGSLITMVTNFLGAIADILGGVLAPILPILANVFDLVASIVGAVLTPAIKFMIGPFEALAPVIWVLAHVFEQLEPLLSGLVTAFLVIQSPFMLLVGPVLQGLFYVIKYVGLGILYVAKGITWAWNGIVGAFETMLRNLANIEIAGVKPFEFLNGMADTVRGAALSMSDLDAGISALASATFDSAAASSAESAEKWKNVEAAKELSAALTNVPSGIKVERLRFNASDAVGGTSSPSAGASKHAMVAETYNVTINVDVKGGDPDEIVHHIEQAQRKKAFLRHGSPLVVSRR